MRNSNILKFAGRAACLALTGFMAWNCNCGTVVSGTISGAGDQQLIVKVLDVNVMRTLDTLTASKDGSFRYKLDVEKGQPEFVYIFKDDVRLASLLVQKGDKVAVTGDAYGNYSVTGSDESVKLSGVEADETAFSNSFYAYNAKLNDLNPSSDAAAQVRKDMTKSYIEYYRSRVKYVMDNSKSLTSIPVLYQVIGGSLPVFGQVTDAIHFKNCYDSLMTVYPQSKYVKALADEVKKRENYLSLNSKLSNAKEAGFPDITAPDINGKDVRLSDVDSKVVMLYFWSSQVAEQKMFNLDVIKPVYEEFRSRGLEIYAVSLDTDKTLWATSVRNQALEWINVCEGTGAASRSAATYNVSSLPTLFFIVDGKIVPSAGVKDEASLRKFLKSVL